MVVWRLIESGSGVSKRVEMLSRSVGRNPLWHEVDDAAIIVTVAIECTVAILAESAAQLDSISWMIQSESIQIYRNPSHRATHMLV